MSSYEIIQGDCLEVMEQFLDGHFSAVVEDPPGGKGHLSKKWDSDRGGSGKWIEWLAMIHKLINDKLLPGAHGTTWSMPSSSHWTGTAIDWAELHIKTLMTHYHKQGNALGNTDMGKACEALELFGSSSPKLFCQLEGVREDEPRKFGSMSERVKASGMRPNEPQSLGAFVLDPQTKEGAKWFGYGTSIRGDGEPWWLWQKDIEEATIAEQLKKTGTGAINREACREFFGGLLPSTVMCFPKPSTAEKEAGLEGLEPVFTETCNPGDSQIKGEKYKDRLQLNSHVTVKSINHMRYLVRLLCPPGGIVLDPFCGSGTTIIAAILEGRDAIGIELDPRHALEARLRCEWWEEHGLNGWDDLREEAKSKKVVEKLEIEGQGRLF